MHIYIVRMDHPDGRGWNTFVREHVIYLKGLIEQGKLLASGPLKNTPLRAGFLILPIRFGGQAMRGHPKGGTF